MQVIDDTMPIVTWIGQAPEASWTEGMSHTVLI